MSTYADPSKAYLWLDGDGWRGEAGIDLPALTAEAIDAVMKPYGGIETGFEVTADQKVEKKKVWNYRQAPYKVARDPLENGMKFRAVDNTEATLLTRAQGGTITKVGENYHMVQGEGEEFSFLTCVRDGDDESWFWCPRATLSAPATRAALDGQNLDGWEFTLTFLEPMVEIIPARPTGMTVADPATP